MITSGGVFLVDMVYSVQGGSMLTQRRKEIYEYITTTHMLSLIIFAIALTTSEKIASSYVYPMLNFRFLFAVMLIGLAAIIIYNAYKLLQAEENRSFSLLDYIYLMLPLLFVALTLVLTGHSVTNFEAVLLLPVLMTASLLGKRPGLVIAVAGTLFLIGYKVFVTGYPAVKAVESSLVLVSLMHVLAWFVGGIIDLRNSSEQELIQSEERFTKAFKANPGPMVIFSYSDGRIIDANESFARVSGYSLEEVRGRTGKELNIWANQGECSRFKSMVDEQKPIQAVEFVFRTKSDEERVGLLNVDIINLGGESCVLCQISDITEIRRYEREMARLERLHLVGEMAAGIGHEIRNPMTTVRGFLQILSGKEECGQYKQYYDLMIEELDRANSIITEYLTLSNNRPMHLRSQDLNSIIHAILPLIESDAVKFKIDINLDTGEIPELLLDEKEIRQLIFNLVRNGLEAIASRGALIIRTRRAGEYVVLSVTDQGRGIAPEILDKIGTPFFTTKDNGTGLGLAVCYSIAERHRATLKVDTGPGGTEVSIWFKTINEADEIIPAAQ